MFNITKLEQLINDYYIQKKLDCDLYSYARKIASHIVDGDFCKNVNWNYHAKEEFKKVLTNRILSCQKLIPVYTDRGEKQLGAIKDENGELVVFSALANGTGKDVDEFGLNTYSKERKLDAVETEIIRLPEYYLDKNRVWGIKFNGSMLISLGDKNILLKAIELDESIDDNLYKLYNLMFKFLRIREEFICRKFNDTGLDSVSYISGSESEYHVLDRITTKTITKEVRYTEYSNIEELDKFNRLTTYNIAVSNNVRGKINNVSIPSAFFKLDKEASILQEDGEFDRIIADLKSKKLLTRMAVSFNIGKKK